ncbi:MAG: ABC transporter permease [Bowdeniella nasicola]|nr:ABC transporter permease [Bowdeniella nasicola]
MAWTTPGRGRGLIDVLNQRYLLGLIVKKELRVRYHGSVLGMAWSYLKPLTQFLVYFVALGLFLGLGRGMIESYPIYLFSGLVVINYFSEVMTNATRTLVWNAPLIKKIYLPREMFPVASIWVAFVHFVPQVIVLIGGALFYSWRPTPLGLVCILAGFTLTTTVALGLGLIFGAVNVYFRDAENFVELILLVATWASPVLYPLAAVRDILPRWLFLLYELNPVTVSVELFHFGFWAPAAGAPDTTDVTNLAGLTLVAFVISVVILLIGQFVFKRLEGRFAQEL